jgi:hypothetical protein
VLDLKLGVKATLDIVGADAYAPAEVPQAVVAEKNAQGDVADVLICGGIGPEWEATLEEALLSLHARTGNAEPDRKSERTAALAFTGDEGLGSAHFAANFYAGLERFEAALARGENPDPGNDPLQLPLEQRGRELFDPAQAMLRVLAGYQHVELYSRPFLEHEDAEELQERIDEWPNLAKRLFLCPDETSLWLLLKQWHGSEWSLRVNPLGWRSLSQGNAI